MTSGLLIFIVILGIVAFAAVGVLLGLPLFGFRQAARSELQGSVRSIVQAQRSTTQTQRGSGKNQATLIQSVSQDAQNIKRNADSTLTLEKKLRFAQWKLQHTVFYLAQVMISATVFYVCSLVFNNPVLLAVSLFAGPLFMHWELNRRMYNRFKAFDKDYPTFILSLIGLIKTGMNSLTALQAASEGLDPESLVRQEVELMLERLRMGVPEDQSIGSFGEDIFHEEIELFVQALLLSRRVGGNLSDTLERLAKQVRKRQYFRESASAAIGQQRLSILIIILILFGITVYMGVVAPDIVMGAWNDEMGKQVVQFCFLAILGGIYWIRQVTKIKT